MGFLKILIALMIIIAKHSGTENPETVHGITVGGGYPVVEQAPAPDKNPYEKYEDFYFTV